MPFLSTQILERFRIAHGKDIDLTLRAPYADLLAALGSPEKKLPPALIVAGTNGKGSTCAFMRAMVEASGRTAHVYTSPHLISFHERIRIAGTLISEEELCAILTEIEKLAAPGGISLFEAHTAAALVAFARHKADVTILEVGLGGRLDATNVLEKPMACLISRLSFDHREYLGNTMTEIAGEKAGIMRRDAPCFTAPQPSAEAMRALRDHAAQKGAKLIVGGADWRIEETSPTRFRFVSAGRTIEDIPRPALLGDHQLWNAGLAIAALSALPFEVSDNAVREAMGKVEWRARLQHLTQGNLTTLLGPQIDLWVDGGHNDSAGEAMAVQLAKWAGQDGRPLDIVFGMLATKNPKEFLGPMTPHLRSVRTVPIRCEMKAYEAEELAQIVRDLGLDQVKACASLEEALQDVKNETGAASRLLICGSLYLAGHALAKNG